MSAANLKYFPISDYTDGFDKTFNKTRAINQSTTNTGMMDNLDRTQMTVEQYEEIIKAKQRFVTIKVNNARDKIDFINEKLRPRIDN